MAHQSYEFGADVKSGQPLLNTYLNQTPAKSEVTIAVSTRVTKNVSLIIPRSKAIVARTIPGPPLAFIATPRLQLENQSVLASLAPIRVPAVSKTEAKARKPSVNGAAK